ncbi:MAG: hypothetical protein A3J51_03280 [Omnitrophica WOR_2 bacterium RIFCSPHIGHO2_02_FULL_45_21]|nr:MAG: hypothetical protein A3J51_03280 [Omnitrophica WOR_2 bacterium RIFCSPHIGHO2_02_FULL_45_21]
MMLMIMSKVKMYLVIIFVLFICSHTLVYAGGWQRLEIGANVSKARAIAIDRDNSDILYLGSETGLYKSIDKAKTWKLLAPGLIREVNRIYLDKQDSKTVYAGCQNGLFRSQDAGNSWEKIFQGKDVFEQNVLSIATGYGPFKSVYLATAGGLFFSPIDSLNWQKAGGKLLDAASISITESPADSDTFYIVSNKGLFKTKDRLSSYERLYSGFNPESEDATQDIGSGEEEAVPQDYFLSHLAFDHFNYNKLYLGSKAGLLFSQDNGKSWNKLVFSGLFNEEINYVLASSKENRLYLATQYGVFDCKQDACHQLYQGMDFNQCQQLAMDDEDNLYLASDKGLYVISSEERKGMALKIDNAQQKLSSPEPAIDEIQKEAIKYGEVYPEKIARWRKQARLKALMPELSLDYDKTVTTALGATYDRVQVGPRDWGLSLKWDLGDLIFSTEQTSIDVRSRLMVQLRDDILNEVTRLYFERKRLQLELSQNILQTKTIKEKELRLEELTALIDGLTNGYLSRRLQASLSTK